MNYELRVLSSVEIAPDIKRIRIEKPLGFNFVAGHAAMLSLRRDDLIGQVRPFTITSTNADHYIEFIIKKYDQAPFTVAMHSLSVGESVFLNALFGSHRFHGPGVFVAGGMGINPMLAMLRQLHNEGNLQGNSLIYCAQTAEDVFCADELYSMLGEKCHITLTRQNHPNFASGRITAQLLKKYSYPSAAWYIAGPPEFVSAVTQIKNQI